MRSYRLEEFTAHSSTVNCLKIGRKSSGVLVTGGDDKKVNVWAIGRPHAILSFSGHQSPIDCVNFDYAEEVVAAGGANGTIKLWDLDSSKVVRNLTGHRASCVSLEFHPFGYFLASGSLDTNIKIWDVRRRECIATLKGHTQPVRQLAMSPDGKWVASGCDNGDVKLWDVSSGRLVHEFAPHDNKVTSLQFHPHEFILATSSADKTVRVWDLETWDLLKSIGPDALPMKAIHFHPAGQHLLTATQDGLKVWDWESGQQKDMEPVGWSKLADMSIYEHRLIGCSFNLTVVGVHVVDLSRIAPFDEPHDDVRQDDAVDDAAHASAREHLHGVAEHLAAQPSNNHPTTLAGRPADVSSSMSGVTSSSSHSDQRSVRHSRSFAERNLTPSSEQAHEVASSQQHSLSGSLPRSFTMPKASPASEGRPLMVSAATSMGDSLLRPPQPDEPVTTASTREQPAASTMPHRLQKPQQWDDNVRHKPPAYMQPREYPCEVNDIATTSTTAAAASTAVSRAPDPLLAAIAASASLKAELSKQLSAVQVAKGFIGRGNMAGAYKSLSNSADPTAAAIVLDSVQGRKDAFELPSIESLVKVLEVLLSSSKEQHWSTSLDVLSLVLNGPGTVIRETCTAAPIGVDLNFEQRKNRCVVAKLALQGLGMKLGVVARGGGTLTARAHQLMAELDLLG